MDFTIGIITIPQRASLLSKLVDELRKQIDECGAMDSVEIVVESDSGETTTGHKRRLIVERASGKFLSFIDDDDWVSPDYVRKILDAIRKDPTVDCIGLSGVLELGDGRINTFSHSIKHKTWFSTHKETRHFRCPNHLNPIRTDILRRFPYEDVWFTEDRKLSDTLASAGALSRETMLDGEPVYIYRPYDVFFTPRPIKLYWTIGMLVSESRRGMATELLQELNKQIAEVDAQDAVQIVQVSSSSAVRGHLRRQVLDRAVGHFVSFVDDDDWVSPTFIASVMRILWSDPWIDCIGLSGLLINENNTRALFTHSIQHKQWYARDGVYYRPPNHLNPVQLRWARAASFSDLHAGEDHEYSMKLINGGSLVREVVIQEPVYYYYPGGSRGARKCP